MMKKNMEVKNEKESESMEKIEKQTYPKLMNLLRKKVDAITSVFINHYQDFKKGVLSTTGITIFKVLTMVY